MKLFWSRRAIDDLRAIRTFVEKDNRTAATKIALHIIESVETMIPENPGIGRSGRVPGTREFVVAHTLYIVPYRVRHGMVEVLRVYHGARRWPDRL